MACFDPTLFSFFSLLRRCYGRRLSHPDAPSALEKYFSKHKLSPFISFLPLAKICIVGAGRRKGYEAGAQAGLPPVSLFSSGRRSSADQHPPPPPIYMGLTTFPIMKYSQVTGSLRNDGGQSIAFQRVIFSPFRRPCLSC